MYTNFHWIFSISYIERIWIFPQIWIFCTCNVQNFPMNFHDSIHSTNSNFSTNLDVLFVKCTKFYVEFHDIIHLMNSNFSMYSYYLSIYCIQFSSVFWWFRTFDEFNFFHKFKLSIHLVYRVFHCIFTISFTHWFCIFLWIHTFCPSNV